MKKVVLSLAVLFSVAMVACNSNKTEENAETVAADTEVMVEETVVADSNETGAAVEAEVVVDTPATAE